MHLAAATALLVGACSFTPGTYTEQTDAGYLLPDGGAVARTCKVSDSALRLCIEFDDGQLSPMVHDGSLGRHDASATNVGFTTRSQSPAAAIGPLSEIHVPETADLDVTTELTVELWVFPTYVPPSGHVTLLANRGEYTIEINDRDQLRCTINGTSTTSNMKVPPGAWTHVACVYDGDVLMPYVSGSSDTCAGSYGVDNTGTAGTYIGADKFGGGIDDVHIYARALDTSELCVHAGHGSSTGCVSQCSASTSG